MDKNVSKNIKPWEHRLRLDVNTTWTFADGPRVDGMIAACSCGNFEFPFADGTDPGDVLERAEPHMESHPMPPLSIAHVGEDGVALVMAVPGPDNSPVHMTVTVSREVYDDGERLAGHLGTIGSPMHFQISEHRDRIAGAMKDMGFRRIEVPPAISTPNSGAGEFGGLGRVVDYLKSQGFHVDEVHQLNPDGTIQVIEPNPQHPATQPTPDDQSGTGSGSGEHHPTIGKKPAAWPGFRQDFRQDYGTFTTDRPIPDSESGVSFRFDAPEVFKNPDFDDPDEYTP